MWSCRVSLSKRSLTVRQQREIRRSIEFFLADNDRFPGFLPLAATETDDEIIYGFSLTPEQADEIEACLRRASRDQFGCDIGWEQGGIRETIREL